MNYMYFGNFTMLRPESIAWRVKILTEILDGRRKTLGERIHVGLTTADQAGFIDDFLGRLQIWILVTSDDNKEKVIESLHHTSHKVEVFSMSQVNYELEKLGK